MSKLGCHCGVTDAYRSVFMQDMGSSESRVYALAAHGAPPDRRSHDFAAVNPPGACYREHVGQTHTEYCDAIFRQSREAEHMPIAK